MRYRRHFQVTVDIVVVLDVTGSMQWCRDEIVDHVCGFADDLTRLQNDWRLALYTFRDLKLGESPHPNPFTATANEFQERVRSQEAEGGGANGGESSIDALFDALRIYEFRPAAARFFLLFTDEPPHEPDQQGRTVADLIGALRRNQIVTYAVTDPIPQFVALSDSLGGLQFNIRDSRGEFRRLFSCVSSSITALSHGAARVRMAADTALGLGR